MIHHPEPLPKISAADALQLLQHGQAVRGYHIVGNLLLWGDIFFNFPVEIHDCWVEELSSFMVQYRHPVRLLNSHFVRCGFREGYFLQGLAITGCTFDGYLDFQSGGHNQPGFKILLAHNVFHGFVNFMDCWYRADVQIEHNAFHGETNLLNFATNYTTFDVAPLIQQNTGNLYRADEGEEPAES